jgi:hypothetical protein
MNILRTMCAVIGNRLWVMKKHGAVGADSISARSIQIGINEIMFIRNCVLNM